ncbi:MAG: DUF309 domain-containing protein [Rhizobiaceae bacterium]|nr:DUF309 domain-containing protein [Rhizobiaceae bacterium]
MNQSAKSANSLKLPPFAYVPGRGKRHEEDFLDHVKAIAATETRNSNAASNRAWLFGLRLIDQAYFWEAHEILETVWLRAAPNSREKSLVQGVIHLANAALKLKMGRPEAAEKLFALADQCISEAFVGWTEDGLMGLDKANLQAVLASKATVAISFSV